MTTFHHRIVQGNPVTTMRYLRVERTHIMRWIGNVLVLCVGLGVVSIWPGMAQGVAGKADADTALVASEPTTQLAQNQTQWAIQPVFGVSSAENAKFLPHQLAPTLGLQLRLYPGPIRRWLSLDISVIRQLPPFEKESSDPKLVQLTMDANIYLGTDKDKELNLVIKPFISVGVGRLFPLVNSPSMRIFRGGFGLEAKGKHVSVPFGIYSTHRFGPRRRGGHHYSLNFLAGVNFFFPTISNK